MKGHDWAAIKQAFPIVTIAGEVTKLRKAGRNFTGCCPFHNEKTPSFFVYPDTESFHCFSGDTKVITWDGTKPIAELAGSTQRLLTKGGLWTDAPVKSFGLQEIWEIDVSRNGVTKTIRTTSGHRWFLKGRKAEFKTHQLKSKHVLQSTFSQPELLNSIGLDGIKHGIVFGDGTTQGGRYGLVNLWGEKMDLVKYFDQEICSYKKRDDVDYIRVWGGKNFVHMKSLPDIDADVEYIRGFIAGYLATDGCVDDRGYVMINSSDLANLEFVKQACIRLGIGVSHISSQMRLGFGKIPTAIYRLNFVGDIPLNMLLKDKAKQRFETLRPKYKRLGWQVKSVRQTSMVEEVFCAEVPEHHAFVLDGNILTGNCFGCSAHGDVVDFVALNDGVDTATALARLTGGQDIRMTDERRAEHDTAMAEREAQTASERKEATARAFDRWRKSAAYDESAQHPYVARKQIERHTARLEGENLIVPVYDADGNLQNVQTINAAGKKLFHKGAPMAGGRLLIGINMGPVIVAEGFATGATLHEACADQVCVTFSMGNMREVAIQLHAAGHSIILAPDAGACTDMCLALGAELGVPVAVPVTADKGDFNDMAIASGHDAVAAVVLKAVRSFAAAKQADAEEEKAETAPVDLWAKPTPPDFPVGLLPNIIEQFAIIRGEQMGVDPGGLAMSALASCATVIRDEIKVKVKRHEDWTESARLWVMLVGDPSYKKSPIISAATRRIKRLDSEMLYANNKALADWQEDGGSKGDQPKPGEPRLRVEDITMEACQEVARHSPDGIMALQDELSGWFGGIEKYAGGKGSARDRGFWLEAYAGKQYTVNRIGRGSFIIENLSVSILGGIQPDPIRRIMGDATDDGLIQRFLPVVLRPAKLGKDEESSSVGADFDAFLECLHELRSPDSVLGPLSLQFDDGARKIREGLEAKHHEMVQRIEGYNKKLSSHIQKFDGLFPRLCIIWHCAQHVAANPASPLPVTISAATAAKVEKFLHDYIMKHSLAFYLGVIGLADDHDQLCDVGGYILAHKLETVTMRTLQRGSRQMRKITREEGGKIFEQMEAFGWLEQVSKRSDAPSWAVNPDVHVLFADRGKVEKAKRSEIRSEIADMTASKKDAK